MNVPYILGLRKGINDKEKYDNYSRLSIVISIHKLDENKLALEECREKLITLYLLVN